MDVKLNKKDYFTVACMKHYKEEFHPNCEEIQTIEKLRKNFIDLKDREHFLETSPKIIEKIDSLENADKIYDYLYDEVITKIVDYYNDGFKIAKFVGLYEATTNAFEVILCPNEMILKK